MPNGIDVIIVDDDPAVCEVVSRIVSGFYVWGDVRAFTTTDEAIAYCLRQEVGVAVFVVDVRMGSRTGFDLLDAVSHKFPMAYEDTIIITGSADNDVVQMCLALNITYLIEKPIRAFSLQMAVQSIVAKYTKFAKKLMTDPTLAAALRSL